MFHDEPTMQAMFRKSEALSSWLIINIEKQLDNTAYCYVIRQIKEEKFQSSITHQSSSRRRKSVDC